jgi:hypothetical protein
MGGHSAESYRCNAELFRLQLVLERVKEEARATDRAPKSPAPANQALTLF